jgi:hypothetical protein
MPKLYPAFTLALAILAALAHTPAAARGGGHGGHSYSHGSGSRHTNSYGGHHSKAIASVHRDSHGRIARSTKAKDAFKKSHPCPSTGKSGGACPGYVIDHVTPLKRGGKDDPSNMQWQTKQDAKAKDKTE